MPMYFPDLESVKRCAIAMSHNKGEKQYKGIIPETEDQLLDARKELADYFRTIWNDEIQAAEVEFAATEENYDKVIGLSILRTLL